MNPLSATRLRDRLSTFPVQPSEEHRLDVWLLSAKMNSEERESYWSTLSADERSRAERFMFEPDKDRSIAARGGLRAILSAYSGVPASALVFQMGSHGKPSLSVPEAPWEFNVSHSGDCVLMGVTPRVPCGVDIEGPRSLRSEVAIAERFFCARELDWMKQTQGGFLRLWTAKESIIKAVGRGLSIPLSDVDVTDVVNGTTSTIALDTPGLEPRTLWLTELKLVEGYAAAAAVDGERHSVRVIAEEGTFDWL